MNFDLIGCCYGGDWGEVRDRRAPGGAAQVVRHSGGGVHMHVRGGVRVVVGPAGVAGAERDIPSGGPVGGAEHQRVGQHVLHVHHSAALPVDALPHEVRALHILRLLRAGHVDLYPLFLAGDEGDSD